jgi:thiol-disulfide isomerase/thioredoxin
MMTRIIVLIMTVVAFSLGIVQVDDQEEQIRYIGQFKLEDLLEHDQRYADGAFIYIPNAEAVEVFRSIEKPVLIKLFYRTDCGDSVREVPRFIKTIQVADNPAISVDVIGVNVAKDEPADLLAGWNIERVPTFIVMFEGKEIGRVVETAQDLIETDLAAILKTIE